MTFSHWCRRERKLPRASGASRRSYYINSDAIDFAFDFISIFAMLMPGDGHISADSFRTRSLLPAAISSTLTKQRIIIGQFFTLRALRPCRRRSACRHFDMLFANSPSAVLLSSADEFHTAHLQSFSIATARLLRNASASVLKSCWQGNLNSGQDAWRD